ncbi:MAG TPA: Ig-like domain-containing protein [Candidatus Dojkabacteria bacterium]
MKVKSIEVRGDKENAEIINQEIQIEFSSPILESEVGNYIKVTPDENYKLSVNGSKLLISFENNIIADTEYIISVLPGLEDRFGKTLERSIDYSFKTKTFGLFFIDNRIDGKNILKFYSESSEFEDILSVSKIKSYSLNSEYLVAVSDEENGSEGLIYIDLKSRDKKIKQFPNTVITSISMSPVKNIVVFSAYDIEETSPGFFIPKGLAGMYFYNIEEDLLEKIDTNLLTSDIGNVEFAADGRTILFEDEFKNEYFLLDYFNREEFISIGLFQQSGGFGVDSDKIVFSESDLEKYGLRKSVISVVDSTREITNYSAIDGFAIDPDYLHRSDEVIYSSKYQELSGSKGLFELKISDGENQRDVFKIDGRSVEFVKLSSDDRFAAFEVYDPQDIIDYDNQRILNFQSKPTKAKIMILNLESGELIKEFSGTMPLWSR